MSDNRPIGVFDSGVGGLTVLQALQRRLPGESTIYLGDLARCPYGVRAQEEVRDFALQIGHYLISLDIKLLVVACNTATAAALPELRDRLGVPVLGVIEPGARGALAHSRTRRIGVVATDGTVASGAYPWAIRRECPEAVVTQRSASWLVPLIERGLIAHGAIAQQLQPLISDLVAQDVDTIILGCTHFPLVGETFRCCVGPAITLVDSATTTAAEVAAHLTALGLEADGLEPWHRFLVTGPAAAFAERAQAMFRTSLPIEAVDLAWDTVAQ